MLGCTRTLGFTMIALFFTASSLLADDIGMAKSTGGAGGLISEFFGPRHHDPSCELKVKEKYDYYDVDGASFYQLRQQMKQNGTKWNDGKVYAALTTWDINYRYDFIADHGKCSIKSVSTDVAIVYHLPRRISSANEPTMLSDAWDTYIQHLKEHEFGHKDLAVKAAGEINERLAFLDGFDTVEDLEGAAKRIVQDRLKQLNEVQVQYDEETHHGVSQGAILPE